MCERKVVFCYGLAYIVCMQIMTTNSRTSTLWKLNTEEGKIVCVTSIRDRQIKDENDSKLHLRSLQELVQSALLKEDEESTFHIITSTASSFRDNTWSRKSSSEHLLNVASSTTSGKSFKSKTKSQSAESDELDCGKPVNFTYYDDLIGIAQRYNHPDVPEPEVAYLFLKKKGYKSFKNFNIDALERRLRKAKSEKPRSVQLYNQIGNFWRIKGNARLSIECFRRALAIAPSNAEVLLNLARVLFNLQYLDDAIHLTRRSLEVQPRDRSAWQQYFTLGEIFKAYGHFQEAVNHLRQALELYPQYEPIKKAIADVEHISTSSLHIFTIIIIVFLVSHSKPLDNHQADLLSFNKHYIFFCPNMFKVMCVLYVILSSSDGNSNSQDLDLKTSRHFNRAMAMRSLKGFTQRSLKNRK
uniref:TPR_REGION domain-containing protein n=1 Tax=Anopheles albimanus TaxID=7167 RepID=A0A182F9W4_ANOAL